MEEYFFNVDNGYLEGLVRGFRSGILTRTDYINLVQCETVEGIILETIRPRAVHGGGGGSIGLVNFSEIRHAKTYATRAVDPCRFG